MDRLLLTWMLQHSMKHSFTRVILEISEGEPTVEFHPCLEPFVLYATCNKILSTKRNGDYQERKMLYSALEKFLESFPSVSNSEMFNNYTKLIFILKWTVRVNSNLYVHSLDKSVCVVYEILHFQNEAQRILGNLIGGHAITALRRLTKKFENEWSALAGDSVIPCDDDFEEVKSQLMEGTSSVSGVYLKLITELSLYSISLLEMCLAAMQSFLPESAIESMMHQQTSNSYLQEDSTLPLDGFERFNHVFSMIKKDSSEDGILLVVKLIHQMPLNDSPTPAVPDKNKKLADVNVHGRDALNGYRKRLCYYKRILRTKHKGNLISPFNRAAQLPQEDTVSASTCKELDSEMEAVASDCDSTTSDIQNSSRLEEMSGEHNAGLISDCRDKKLVSPQENAFLQNKMDTDSIGEVLSVSEINFTCAIEPSQN